MSTLSEQLINRLKLQPHPEGGYFRRMYESQLSATFWPDAQQRSIQTAIIYLLQANDFSAFHRIRSDELWLLGEATTSVRIVELTADGVVETMLCRDNPVHCVPAGRWFAAELISTNSDDYALCYCTVAPGFDFQDFQMAIRNDLMQQFPDCEQTINRFCKK